MSVRVDLTELHDVLAELGETCFLLTTNDDQSPHAANVRVEYADGRFILSAGRRSCANGAERSAITLLWPVSGEMAMSLLVDGFATVESVDEGVISLEPTSAIWHRKPE